MQGILINADEQSIQAISLATNVADYYKQVNQALRCNSHTDVISTDKKMQLIIDDDCVLKTGNPAFIFSVLMDTPLFGNIILIGWDSEKGEKIDLDQSIDVLQLMVDFTLSVDFLTKEMSERARLQALKYAERVARGK